jgi:hypothetical protein
VWESIGPWLTPGGLIALTVLSLIRGWLIPRSWHRERIQDYKDTIAAKDATIAELKAQIAVLLGATESV